MTTIKLSCKVQGTISIPSNYYTSEGGFSTSGNLADYEVGDAQKLHKIASKYTWIERNGKRIKGALYSLKMAQNDFIKHAR